MTLLKQLSEGWLHCLFKTYSLVGIILLLWIKIFVWLFVVNTLGRVNLPRLLIIPKQISLLVFAI